MTCAARLQHISHDWACLTGFGRVLNHGTELRRTITARVHVQHDFAVEKKMALDAWASELKCIVSSQSAAHFVVELKSAKVG